MYCRLCGCKIEEDSSTKLNFCPYCGGTLKVLNSSNELLIKAETASKDNNISESNSIDDSNAILKKEKYGKIIFIISIILYLLASLLQVIFVENRINPLNLKKLIISGCFYIPSLLFGTLLLIHGIRILKTKIKRRVLKFIFGIIITFESFLTIFLFLGLGSMFYKTDNDFQSISDQLAFNTNESKIYSLKIFDHRVYTVIELSNNNYNQFLSWTNNNESNLYYEDEDCEYFNIKLIIDGEENNRTLVFYKSLKEITIIYDVLLEGKIDYQEGSFQL